MRSLASLITLVLCLAAVGIANAQSLAGADANAQQQQSQGQQQNAFGGKGGSGGSNDFTIANSFNGAAPIRSLPFATPVAISTEGGPGYFAAPNYGSHGPNFMTMKKLVTVLNAAKLDQPTKPCDIETVTQPLGPMPKMDKKKKKVTFHLMKGMDPLEVVEGFKPTAVVTMKADEGDTINSASLAVHLKNVAEKYNSTEVILMEEGVVKRITSWGMGIGLSYNYASVGSGASDNGNVGAGGTGISWGEAEYLSLPYLTAIVGSK